MPKQTINTAESWLRIYYRKRKIRTKLKVWLGNYLIINLPADYNLIPFNM